MVHGRIQNMYDERFGRLTTFSRRKIVLASTRLLLIADPKQLLTLL